MSWSNSVNRLCIGAALVLAGQSCFADVLHSAPGGAGEFVVQGSRAMLSVSFSPDPSHVGQAGAIFLTVDDGANPLRYLTAGGLSETPIPVKNGALPAVWQQSIDLQSLSKERIANNRGELNCAALVGNGMAPQVIVRVGYSVYPATSIQADPMLFRINDSFDKLIFQLKKLGRTEEVAQAERQRAGFIQAYQQKRQATSTDPSNIEQSDIESWQILAIPCL